MARNSLPLIFAFLLVVLVSFPLSKAQTGILDLEVFIFSDGSAFFQGTVEIDPQLPVAFENGVISGLTNSLTSKDQETWHFSLTSDVVFDEVSVRIVLPENAKLVTGSISSASLPLVYTRGKSLVVEISDIQKALDISFSYELPLTQQRESNIPVILIYLIAVLIAIAIIILILRSKKKVRPEVKKKRKAKSEKKPSVKEEKKGLEGFKEKFETVRQTLNEREVRIVEGLIELKGKAKQNQLQKFTGISKAAFSRHIAALEAKGLIEKKSLGRVNLIQAKLG